MAGVSILIPIYNDVASLRVLLDRLVTVLRDEEGEYRVVVVDDGSFPPVVRQMAGEQGGLPLDVVTLTRNVGHQRALAVGLAYEVSRQRAQHIVVMDGDGEDRPEDVPRLLAAARQGEDNTIAVASRTRRSEGLAFAMFYHAYRFLFMLLVGETIRFGNFSAMTAWSADRLTQMNELWLNLPATMIRMRANIISVPTDRGTRYHGTPHMNLVSLVAHGLSAVAVFVQRVLTRVILASLALAAFCVAAAVLAVILKAFGAATPGWVTTVVGIMFSVLILTGMVCLVGLFMGMTAASQLANSPHESHARLIADVAHLPARTSHTTPGVAISGR